MAEFLTKNLNTEFTAHANQPTHKSKIAADKISRQGNLRGGFSRWTLSACACLVWPPKAVICSLLFCLTHFFNLFSNYLFLFFNLGLFSHSAHRKSLSLYSAKMPVGPTFGSANMFRTKKWWVKIPTKFNRGEKQWNCFNFKNGQIGELLSARVKHRKTAGVLDCSATF